MKIGILGSGIVGKTLAAGFLKYGHQVKIGSSDTNKLNEWLRTCLLYTSDAADERSSVNLGGRRIIKKKKKKKIW